MLHGIIKHFCILVVTTVLKQGGMIYPIFFNLYPDTMLIRLRESRIGCHISNVLLVVVVNPLP